jgi:hypothetical protein
MKVSKTFFWTICLLALLLPFSSNWKLLFFGKKTFGEVIDYRKLQSIGYGGNRDTYSIIQFSTDYETITFLGPDNLILPLGKKIKVLYDKKKPTHCMPLNIATLYLGRQMILPAVFLFLWIAFYVSLKQTEYQKRKKLSDRNFFT